MVGGTSLVVGAKRYTRNRNDNLGKIYKECSLQHLVVVMYHSVHRTVVAVDLPGSRPAYPLVVDKGKSAG